MSWRFEPTVLWGCPVVLSAHIVKGANLSMTLPAVHELRRSISKKTMEEFGLAHYIENIKSKGEQSSL